MKIVVVSNSTMQPLASRLAGHDVVFSGVGEVLPWLLDESAPTWAPETDLVLVCIDGDSSLPPLGEPAFLDEVLVRSQAFAERRSSVQVIITTLLASRRSAASLADFANPIGRWHVRARWDVRIAEMAAMFPNVGIIDLDGLAQENGGIEALSNSAMWYLGRIRFSYRGFDAMAEELRVVIHAVLARAAKVLVLDLDNTLWGGVLGEDGPSGIEVGEEGQGKAYRDFQRHILAIKRAGVLLAIISKNDAEPVEGVLRTHPMMVLRSDDFVSISADWTNKADRLTLLAENLGLGIDSLVLLDDSPVERALVQRVLPTVGVPEFPENVELLSQWFLQEVVPRYFPRFRVLDEDKRKTQSYRSRALRRSEQEITDLAGFIATLDVELDFVTDSEENIQRISQLTQKTNQFNLTTERLSPSDVKRMIDDSDVRVIACRYSDRFGEEGLIGVALLDVAAAQLLNLMLSCRVVGRGVEFRLLAEAERIGREAGVKCLTGRYVPSGKNTLAADFLVSAGFDGSATTAGWVGSKELA